MTTDTKPTAIVTGASSGIGLATAEAFLKAGYRVFGTSRNAQDNANPDITMIRCDVTDDASVAAAIAAIVAQTGRIDVLVNNAGVGMAGPAEDTSIDQARQLFDVNVFGMMRVIQAVLPVMRAAGRGRVVNISSVFGFMPAPFMAVYAATKHAVEGYTESLDHEVRGFGIRAVCVEPANTKTAFDANLIWATGKLDAYATMRPRIAMMLQGMMDTGDDPALVADAVVQAAGDRTGVLRFTAGKGRKLSILRRFVPAKAFDKSLRKQLGLSKK